MHSMVVIVSSLFNGLYQLPAAGKLLFPQADSIVSRAYGQDIATLTPTDSPRNVLKGWQSRASPIT
jgi:hypothetical protein